VSQREIVRKPIITTALTPQPLIRRHGIDSLRGLTSVDLANQENRVARKLGHHLSSLSEQTCCPCDGAGGEVPVADGLLLLDPPPYTISMQYNASEASQLS